MWAAHGGPDADAPLHADSVWNELMGDAAGPLPDLEMDSLPALPAHAGVGADVQAPNLLVQGDDALNDLPEEINIQELGLDGPGAHGSPGETKCLFCFTSLPPGPSNKRWQHNVQHPFSAAALLSSRPNPLSGKVETWTVQLKPRRGPMLRLQANAQAPWFARKVDRNGNKVRRPQLDPLASRCTATATLCITADL